MKPDVLRSGCCQVAATDAQMCRSQGAKALDDLTKRMGHPSAEPGAGGAYSHP